MITLFNVKALLKEAQVSLDITYRVSDLNCCISWLLRSEMFDAPKSLLKRV